VKPSLIKPIQTINESLDEKSSTSPVLDLEDLSGEELDRLLGELSNPDLAKKIAIEKPDSDSQISYGSEIEAAMEEELNKIIEKENKNTTNTHSELS
jgi:hypothetical protein